MSLSLLRLLPALLVLTLPISPPAHADTLVGTVVRILDGDTVEVLDARKRTHRVRLAGIDAPESKQPFGAKSKRVLSSLVGGETVAVDWHKRDRYDRLVGKIMLDGADMNLALVRAGYAWWYREYAGEQSPSDRGLYAAAEKAARRDGVGLWADPRPIAPWDWRDGGATAVPAKPSSGACPCDSGRLCTGPRGGIYCVRESGSKQYFPRD
ncbi:MULTISPECIES: thermonuclease family protein [unclassified Thiocapsa]|uniref:thermonuclease family protein n=1 Tax=unclassified Thiocapsa TaxID=2641286 RepID=UPI0035B2CAD7